jgi:hypothetical protein
MWLGLYLNPPDQAVVLCMDEKSSIQALDRTQATLPMVKGRAATMTHDYKRHGTTRTANPSQRRSNRFTPHLTSAPRCTRWKSSQRPRGG